MKLGKVLNLGVVKAWAYIEMIWNLKSNYTDVKYIFSKQDWNFLFLKKKFVTTCNLKFMSVEFDVYVELWSWIYKYQASPPHISDPHFTFTNHILIKFPIFNVNFLLFSFYFFLKIRLCIYFLNTFKKLGEIFIPFHTFFFNWQISRKLFTLWLANNLLNITFWFMWENNLIFFTWT